jgi:hypothetical protein
MELLEGRVLIPPGQEHPLQYAIVEGLQYPMDPIIYGTEKLDDDAVISHLLLVVSQLTMAGQYRLIHLAGYRSTIRVIRFDRCPTCEQWSPCDVRKARTSD